VTETGTADDGRSETPTERLDRNWNELLQELRVTQTGVQILTGFLLTLPFQARFSRLSAFDRHLYLVVLLLAATATALLIAPVSAHRILFRRRRKATLVTLGDVSAKVGLSVLALTVAGVVLLVFDVVLGLEPAVVTSVATLGLIVGLWLGVPLLLRRNHPQR
jgi:hypothetical protein